MNIKRIDITNFRGYERKSFEFDERLTVIVGNNTAGKTALLQALQVGLGGYLASLKSLPSDAAYRHNFTQNDILRKYDPEKKDFFENEGKTRVDITANWFSTEKDENDSYELVKKEIGWWREMRGGQTTHSRECAGELMDKVSEMELLRQTPGSNSIFPIVLSFGANRIDNQYRSASKTKERASRVSIAYRSALRETVDFKSAFDWLYRYEQNIKQGAEFEKTREAFIEALELAIPAMKDIHVDSKNNELWARLEVTGQQPAYQTFDLMSDGFKSIICIVAEIAHRCIELNGFLGIDAVRRTPGVVMIDELDLYLHPRWQRHLLKDLEEAFPLIQFIVTSHSPFIIQSVRKHNLITLDGVNDDTDPIFRSIEEIVTKEMALDTPRSAQYKQMLDKAERYYQLVKSGKGDTKEANEVNKELDEIEIQFSSDPAYVALLKAERAER